MAEFPVVCIDGPSGAGKGTAAVMVAQALGYHLLDSGALYRVVAIAAEKRGVSPTDEAAVADIANTMRLDFAVGGADEPVQVLLEGENITHEVRLESTGAKASVVAPLKAVRAALLDYQRHFVKAPGLVADGRDMGTVVFPESPYKIFLTASAEERADRRFKQLKNKGVNVSLAAVLEDIRIRDDRDMNRATAPLKAADDALTIDSTSLSIKEVVDSIVAFVRSR
ncbi:(d)CMP kinase [Umboniibacter marinipuniceus]|uniref:Cytidylate kinase n=1 Tax=Umboniibacter marinipuniceus TaxID=569599 RepID=A0A3M0A7S4_9GAMM|nr:(d)CMP kinase [Umboniibacter marinipuniceus]RMA81201.1 cytidylate kinase [Umboniibacter marinipuniceus]